MAYYLDFDEWLWEKYEIEYDDLIGYARDEYEPQYIQYVLNAEREKAMEGSVSNNEHYSEDEY